MKKLINQNMLILFSGGIDNSFIGILNEFLYVNYLIKGNK